MAWTGDTCSSIVILQISFSHACVFFSVCYHYLVVVNFRVCLESEGLPTNQMASRLWQAGWLISASLTPSSVGKAHLSDYPVTSLNKSRAKSCPPMTSPPSSTTARWSFKLQTWRWAARSQLDALARSPQRRSDLKRDRLRLQLLWLCVCTGCRAPQTGEDFYFNSRAMELQL